MNQDLRHFLMRNQDRERDATILANWIAAIGVVVGIVLWVIL